MFYRGNGSANAHRHGAGQDRVRQGKDEPPTGEIRGSSEEGRKEGRKGGREGGGVDEMVHMYSAAGGED